LNKYQPHDAKSEEVSSSKSLIYASIMDDHIENINADDVVICVMGVTGAGKSTFVARVTGEDVGIGHQLMSRKIIT
jgi:ABC-type uncharacterized transport system ATPase component